MQVITDYLSVITYELCVSKINTDYGVYNFKIDNKSIYPNIQANNTRLILLSVYLLYDIRRS